MTANEWLALGDELALELAKVFTLKPWEHDTDRFGFVCNRCGNDIRTKIYGWNSPLKYVDCSVPDRIRIDWNTAMEWRNKTDEDKFDEGMWLVYRAVDCGPDDMGYFWMVHHTHPKHFLIAAALTIQEITK